MKRGSTREIRINTETQGRKKQDWRDIENKA